MTPNQMLTQLRNEIAHFDSNKCSIKHVIELISNLDELATAGLLPDEWKTGGKEDEHRIH